MKLRKSSDKILAKAHKILRITLQRKTGKNRPKGDKKHHARREFHLPGVFTVLSAITAFIVRHAGGAVSLITLLSALSLNHLLQQDKNIMSIDNEAVEYIAEIFAPQYQFLISNIRIKNNDGSINLLFDNLTISDKQDGNALLLLDDVDARFYVEDFIQLEIFPRYLHADKLIADLHNASNIDVAQQNSFNIDRYTQEDVLVDLLQQFHNSSVLMSGETIVESGYVIDNISLHVLGKNNREIDIDEGVLSFSQGTPDIDLSMNARISVSNTARGINIENMPFSFGIVWHQGASQQAEDKPAENNGTKNNEFGRNLITAYIATAPTSVNKKHLTFPQEISQYGLNQASLRRKLLSPGTLTVQMSEKDGLYHSDVKFNWIGGFDFNVSHPKIDSLITGKSLNISGKLDRLNLLSLYVILNVTFQQPYWTDISITGNMMMRRNSKGEVDTLDMQFNGENGALKLPFFPTVFDMTQWSVNLRYVKPLLSNNYYEFEFQEPARNIAISNQLVFYKNKIGERIFQLDYQLAPMFFNRLLDYWPQAVIPDTRKWVTDSITQLEITRLDGELEYVLGTDGNLTLTKLEGSADIERGIVRPYDGLPVFDNISGKIAFTDTQIDVSVTEIYHTELKFDTEQFALNIDMATDNIALKTRLVFRSTLEILLNIGRAFEPFFVDYESTLEGLTGNANVDMVMEFSLSDFDNHPLDITADASVGNVDFYISGFSLADGTGNLRYVNEELTANLTVMSGESALEIEWLDNFTKGTSLINIGGHLSASQVMKDIYEPFAKDMQGEIAIDGTYIQDRGKVGTFKLYGDMQDVTVGMQGLYLSKTQGEAGSIIADARILLDDTVLFDEIAFDFAGLNAKGTMLVDEVARAFIDIPELSWGRSRFSLEGVVEVNGDAFMVMDGESIDFSGLTKEEEANWFVDRLSEETGDPTPGIVAIEGAVDKVYFVPDNDDIYARDMLYNITLDQYTTDMYMDMSYGEKQNFIVSYQDDIKEEDGEIRLDISSLTEFVKIVSDDEAPILAGERLKLTSQRPKGEPYYAGRLETGNLTIYGVPVIGTILETISLVTLNLSVLQKGYQAQGFFLDFDYDDQRRIIIKNMRMYSLAQGVTGTGVVDLENSTINIEGTVIPLYLLSVVLGKTPILGPLLIGGEQDGLFGVGYNVTGDMEAPDINVDPLDAITPGFIKNIRSTLTTSPAEEALLENAAKAEKEQ
ncbi:MAG: AsmA-like C-terminal domain-containing protein [Alphaproteobacteria bacterium]|nr:AsmA-like C-terminal domain-containing protein [Alphaproteobacteria bacterium]